MDEQDRAHVDILEKKPDATDRNIPPWYRRFWHWIRKDLNAFLVMLATIAMAIFTAELYCVSNRQNQIAILTNAPDIRIGDASFNADQTAVFIPYTNEGQWTAHRIGNPHLALMHNTGNQVPAGGMMPTVYVNDMPACEPSDADPLPIEHAQGYRWVAQVQGDPRDIFVFGCVGYTDSFGNKYQTPICR